MCRLLKDGREGKSEIVSFSINLEYNLPTFANYLTSKFENSHMVHFGSMWLLILG